MRLSTDYKSRPIARVVSGITYAIFFALGVGIVVLPALAVMLWAMSAGMRQAF